MADDKWARHLFNTVYKGFLDPKEMESMIDGKDLWMNPAEVGKRLEKRNNLAKKARGPKKKQKALLSPTKAS